MSRCTKCSEVIKPIVAVDIDGTLGNYHEHFTLFAEGYVGKRLPIGYDGADEFSDFLLMEKQLYRDAKLAYRQGGLKRSMPVYPGAVNFMKGLRKLGVEIWIATTRPWLRLDNIDPDTRFWLQRSDIPYDYIIYGEDKYQELTSRVERDRVIMVVEDQLPLCWDAMRQLRLDPADSTPSDWPVIQPTMAHTRQAVFPNRFKDYNELGLNIAMREEQWSAEHRG